MERYEILRDIGSGNFGVAKLVRDKWSGELYAVKYIERGPKVWFCFSNSFHLLSPRLVMFMILYLLALFIHRLIWVVSFLSLWIDFKRFLGYAD